MNRTRLITVDDAPAVAEALSASRDFLAPWEPLRDDDFFTVARQRAIIEDDLRQHEQGMKLPHVIVDDGGVVGRITLNGIVRGPFQSCSMGYWVRSSHTGRGIATAAVREMVRVAFDEVRLHRIQAETLLDNVASRRVLARNGFEQVGMAPAYLKIAGRWQDCLLHQLINASYED